MKKTIYKAPKGKLLRVEFDLDGGVIKSIKICGDFFIHPEEAIIGIEGFLKGKRLDRLEADLAEFLKEKKIKVIGFEPADLREALSV